MLVKTNVLMTVSVAKAAAMLTGHSGPRRLWPTKRVNTASAATMAAALARMKAMRACSSEISPKGDRKTVAPGL